MKVKLIKLKQYMIDRYGENPECRGCGGILFAEEDVYVTEGHGKNSRWNINHFCLDCIENKDVIVYPIKTRGRGHHNTHINASFPFTPKRSKKEIKI